MRFTVLPAVAALLTAGVAPAADDDVSALAARFGAREAVSRIGLSPDGRRIVVVSPDPNTTGQRVMVIPIGDGGDARIVMRTGGASDRVSGCAWQTDARLVCTALFRTEGPNGPMGFTRVMSLSADGGDLKQLSSRRGDRTLGEAQFGGSIIDWLGGEGDGNGSGSGAQVLMTRQYAPESTLDTNIRRTEGLGVERVNTATLRRSTVEAPNPIAVEYHTDGHGTVRVRGLRPPGRQGYDGDVIAYEYRLAGSREWKPLSRWTSSTNAGFNPYAVDRDLNAAYGFDRVNGRLALLRVRLDGSLAREMVTARPDVDVDDLVTIGRQRRVVGVGYATDRRQVEFFDPELKRLAASLSRAMPGLPLIQFVDATADENKLLLWAGSDVDPGRYYLYDKGTRKLGELLASRPQLAGQVLSPVRAVTFPAGDGTPIPGYLTLPPGAKGAQGLPAIVMPHGGPSARDEWGFDWMAQFFAARGFAVLQPNFRGSSGYGEAWFQKNGFQSWRTAVGDVADGGRWLVSQGADAARLAIVGWSYGGYAALQSAAIDPALFKAVVAVAPVTDLETLRSESLNYSNHALVDGFIGRGPHVREGSPAQNAARFAAPVLMFHGNKDVNVGVGESRLMAARLKSAGKPVEYVEFDGLDHQLDAAAARTTLLTRTDAFLRRTLGM